VSNDHEASIVIETLTKHMGFEAKSIPEQPALGERADIWACKGGDSYLFEVKSREDHPALMDDIRNAQPYEGTLYSGELKRRNTLSSIVEKASRQLSNTPKPNGEFSCIWFRIVEELIPDGVHFILATLYGIKYLSISDLKSGRTGWVECYYFDYNDFYDYKNIDGVILDNGKGKLRLCVNDYGRAGNRFRKSELCEYFRKTDQIIDPLTFDLESGKLVADIDCPRREVDKLRLYLQNKYNIEINRIYEMKSLGGAVTFP
jgi:hypothetical protein